MGKFVTSSIVTTLLLLEIFALAARAQLQTNFYAKTCPNAEKIVQDYVHKHIPNAPSLAAALIRMHFHDCFVRVRVFLIYFRWSRRSYTAV